MYVKLNTHTHKKESSYISIKDLTYTPKEKMFFGYVCSYLSLELKQHSVPDL